MTVVIVECMRGLRCWVGEWGTGNRSMEYGHETMLAEELSGMRETLSPFQT